MDLMLRHPNFLAPAMRAAFFPVEEGTRHNQFLAGRQAARSLVDEPVTADLDGAPLFPPPWTGSIAHTSDLAVALCAPAGEWTVGVDVERLDPERPAIASLILRDDESVPTRWEELLRIFCLKEALYKALYPRVRRYIDFKEAFVRASGDGSAEITVALDCGQLFVAEGASLRFSHWMIAWARVRQGIEK
jgi:4'-phosphopantetheinyl transferase EntD